MTLSKTGINQVRPLGERLVIEVLATADKWGGIDLPSNIGEKLLRCKVIAIGPDATDRFSLGDIVIITNYVGTTIDIFQKEIPSDRYKILLPGVILAKWCETEEEDGSKNA